VEASGSFAGVPWTRRWERLEFGSHHGLEQRRPGHLQLLAGGIQPGQQVHVEADTGGDVAPGGVFAAPPHLGKLAQVLQPVFEARHYHVDYIPTAMDGRAHVLLQPGFQC
jgi:hypothetical protein